MGPGVPEVRKFWAKVVKFEFMIFGFLPSPLPFSSHLPGVICQYDSRWHSMDAESLLGMEPPRGPLHQKHLFWSLWSQEMKVYCDVGVDLP